MLIKLIVVDSNHFIRYKYKITHCLNSQTLSEYISTIVLDKNKKLSINEVLQVLTGVGTFTSTSSFDMQSLQFVTMNELEKSMSQGLQLLPFYPVVLYSICFLLEFEATFHNSMLLGRRGKYIYPQWSSIFLLKQGRSYK